MPGQLEKKQAGIGLLNFNSSDIWFAPGDSINSTAAFHHATHLEEQAYVANRWLFTSIMIVVFIFVLLQVPHTYIRIKSSPSIWYNFKLLPPGPDEVVEKKQAGYSAPPHRTSSAKPRRRLRHIHWPIPIYRVRGFDLPLSEFIVMFTLLAAGLGVAGWCQGSFLTDASRSTLVIMFFLALTAGLGIKAGGIGSWLSYGYTAINFLHRWTGRLVLLLSTLHVVAYLVVFYKYGIAKTEMAKPANYLAAVAYGGLCLTGIVSIGYIRRRWWLIFKFGHHFGILLLLAGLNYHSGDVVPYLVAIWGLIIINTLFRSITTRLATAHILALPGASSTLVTFPALTRGFTPGQHVRIRMSRSLGLGWKALFESHPFTIASADANGEAVQCVVKQAGDWTTALHQLALHHPEGLRVRCTVEGPYGGPINFIFPAFSSVLVVVGGSGVSFGLGVIRGLINDVRRGNAACKHLTLVWTVRHRDHLEALVPPLEGILRSTDGLEAVQPDFHLDLILCFTGSTHLLPITEKTEDKTGSDPLESITGTGTSTAQVHVFSHRPDLSVILDDVIKTTVGGGVGVGACGPGFLVEGLQKLVNAVPKEEKKRVGGVEIHAERFSL